MPHQSSEHSRFETPAIKQATRKLDQRHPNSISGINQPSAEEQESYKMMRFENGKVIINRDFITQKINETKQEIQNKIANDIRAKFMNFNLNKKLMPQKPAEPAAP